MNINQCSEFFEGVRALLIDKDKSPRWKHSTVDQVTDQEVNYLLQTKHIVNLDILKYRVKEYDVAVIGGGPGGYVAAIKAG